VAVPSAGTWPVAYAWGLERKSLLAAEFVAVAVAAGAAAGRYNCMSQAA
jgi:hypothetical protein